MSKPTSDIVEEFSWIGESAPCIGISADNVKIITEPKEFYCKLKELALASKKRVVFATLYLGTGELERNLVKTLEQALSQNDSSFKMRILLDHCRGTRDEPNSCSLLQNLVSQSTNKDVKIHLYHTPKLRGFLRWLLPSRINEVIGLQHMKLYIFDNTLIISGANLSDSYFVDRQDRCFVTENCPQLADFYDQIVDAVCSCSFELKPNGQLTPDERCHVHPFLGDDTKFCSMVHDRVMNVIDEYLSKSHHSSSYDTVIYPLIQMGPFGIDIENCVIRKILSSQDDNRLLSLASGYFNLTSSYSNLILERAKYKVEALTASPRANGFFGSNGFSRFIPSMYSCVAQFFFDAIQKLGVSDRISMFEYDRTGWTFHAKGLWWSTLNNKQQNTIATFVGSTNFGYRSVHRDLEAQLVIVTNNTNLQRKLQEEKQQLFNYGKLIEKSTYKRPDHYVPFWVRIISRWIRNFF